MVGERSINLICFQAALRRASAVIRSQKAPKIAKKAKVATSAPATNKKVD